MTDIERKTCPAADGLTIVYSAAGSGEPGLVFIHGGLADRTFWDDQLRAFAGRHRVAALDLPGHGESGCDRTRWGLPEFGADAAAVARAERMKRVIFIGNSLGGPAAVEAALLLPGTAVGVVGVESFQSLDLFTVDETRERAESFRADYAGQVKAMTRSLFHPDADPEVVADAERRMARTSPRAAYPMLLAMGGYDPAASVRGLAVPLRTINGDLYPTETEANLRIKPDFEAVIMAHMGHYPMLERPEELNRHLARVFFALAG